MFGENTLFSIKLTNPLQKYPLILEYMYLLNIACILKIFCFNIFIIYKYLISSGLCSTPKVPKHVATLFLAYIATQWVPILTCLLRFIKYVPSFILGKLFLE